MTWTKGKSILIAGGGVLLLILAVLILQRVFQSDTVKLPDGSEMRVFHLSFGKTHPFPPDAAPWRRMLWALPTNITARLGFRRRIYRTMEDKLVVWFEWERGTNS